MGERHLFLYFKGATADTGMLKLLKMNGLKTKKTTETVQKHGYLHGVSA